MSRYRNVARFAAETPWAIMPETLGVIQEILTARLSGERWSDAEIEARLEAAGGRRPTRQARALPGGVAVVPLSGVIVPRANMMSDMSGGTSVQDFTQALNAAAADPEIGAIVIDIDSPGGSTDLVTEAAAQIRALRGTKPILAVADTHMASAAYWLGSQADEVSVTPSGLVGSIGVVAMHRDMSAANEKDGINPTLISAGKYKTEGSPNAPLTGEGLAHIQSLVDGMYQTFTLDVAKGRGVPVDQVRSGYGEGRMVGAKDAVKQGLADRVATLEQTISRAAGLAAQHAGTLSHSAAAFDTRLFAGPIPPKSTATTDTPWDGPAQKANLANDKPETYRQAYAWYDSSAADPDGDGYPDAKADYKFIHHMVSADGTVGAANLGGCLAVIANLNGARSAPSIPAADRQGVYNHAAKHLRDAGKEPPPLKSEDETATPEAATSGLLFAARLRQTLGLLEADVATARGLASVRERDHLTAPKREQFEAIADALGEFGTVRDTIVALLADTDPEKPRREAQALAGAYLERLHNQRGAIAS